MSSLWLRTEGGDGLPGGAAGRGTEEMMQPCVIYLHVISLVAQVSYRAAPPASDQVARLAAPSQPPAKVRQ